MRRKPLRILIAEDEAMILLGFMSFISEMGHQVIGEAYDGENAVCLAKKLNPDLIIMDIKMPKVDGITALRRINDGQADLIPCIFVTAFSDIELIENAKDAGAFNYLIKPISYESLRAAIEIAMDRFEDYKKVQEELTVTKLNLHNRKIIEKAKGILMDEFDLKEQKAMEYLQKKSRNTNRKLIDVAKDVIYRNQAINEYKG